jgi:hypothetical protein
LVNTGLLVKGAALAPLVLQVHQPKVARQELAELQLARGQVVFLQLILPVAQTAQAVHQHGRALQVHQVLPHLQGQTGLLAQVVCLQPLALQVQAVQLANQELQVHQVQRAQTVVKALAGSLAALVHPQPLALLAETVHQALLGLQVLVAQ